MSARLIQRIPGILLRPAAEWTVIETEPASLGSLFGGYACVLGGLGFAGGFVAGMMAGSFRRGGALGSGLLMGLAVYALTLGVVAATGVILEVLAPAYGATLSRSQAMKLPVYAATPVWIALIAVWIPWLGPFLLLAALAYGAFILRLGIVRLVRPAPGGPVDFTTGVLAAGVALSLIAIWIASLFATIATMLAYH